MSSIFTLPDSSAGCIFFFFLRQWQWNFLPALSFCWPNAISLNFSRLPTVQYHTLIAHYPNISTPAVIYICLGEWEREMEHYPHNVYGAEYRSRPWVWSTVVRRPSEVYDTHWRTKLTAPETISRSRDIVCAHQNLTGSRDLTTPLSGRVCHPWASTCYHQPTYQIWSLYLYSLQRYERRYKMSKMAWFG